MERWRVLLRLSADLHDPGEVQAIDATGFYRRAAIRRYARRTNCTFRAVKTAVLVDCETSTILDIHCSMKRSHDMQIGEQLLKRNLDQVETITADKGYGWDELRHKLRKISVIPVIKHCKFSPLDAAFNARLDDETYHRRSVVESVIRSLKRRFGDTLRARIWFGQFRELAFKAAVKYIEVALSR